MQMMENMRQGSQSIFVLLNGALDRLSANDPGDLAEAESRARNLSCQNRVSATLAVHNSKNSL